MKEKISSSRVSDYRIEAIRGRNIVVVLGAAFGGSLRRNFECNTTILNKKNTARAAAVARENEPRQP